MLIQRAKKGVSDRPGLVNLATRLVNSVLNLLHGQVRLVQVTKKKIVLLVKKKVLVKMTFGLEMISLQPVHCYVILHRMVSC